ncbi:hypothetical protein GAP53_14660 [Bacteroides uniformis]|uniref:Uncharacterized protein n=1 Tax=Bacteroides uniformis TaxID=820 RepID=A0A4Q5E5K4_BACUN|nr:hypothetical protein GAP45_15515 [Bacteroides uniformis]KAB4219950.1 hypothetical protein GAP53_14660 [Bacteroides uniformis]KAB4226286.1 hypothetical protein GAP44_17590 [Bacteroides uniformis]KAB4236838.1 hypothetical protein GAP54_17340 [Bacteroides uniformis]KAB4238892.1 hypothetical protein GAP41_17215 [Bacteroides uniformis]
MQVCRQTLLAYCFFLCKWLVFFPQRTALSPTKSLLMTIVHGCDATSSLLWYGFFMLVEKPYHNSAHV